MLTEQHGRALSGAIYGCSCRHGFLVTFLSFQCAIGTVAAALVGLGRVFMPAVLLAHWHYPSEQQ